MAVGYPKTRAEIDDRAGNLATTVRNLFDEIDRFQAFLATMPDADLTAAPINYTSQDVAYLKSAMTDLARLGRVFRGQEPVSPAYDFRQFAKLLMGVR
jgi:hypothetical protein